MQKEKKEAKMLQMFTMARRILVPALIVGTLCLTKLTAFAANVAINVTNFPDNEFRNYVKYSLLTNWTMQSSRVPFIVI